MVLGSFFLLSWTARRNGRRHYGPSSVDWTLSFWILHAGPYSLYLPSLHAALFLNFTSGVHFPLPLSFLHAGPFLFSTNQRSIHLSTSLLCTPLFFLTPFPAFIFLCLVPCHSLFCTPGTSFFPQISGQSTSLPAIPARRSFPLTSLPAFIFLCLVLCLSLFCTPGPAFFPRASVQFTSLSTIPARRSFP